MTTPSSNTTILIIASLVVAGGAYWYFFTGSPASEGSFTAGSSQSAAQAQFETLIGQLGPISFDLTILSDPRFNALVDLTMPITPEPTGRKDPFAPIPGVSKK
ncbi:MAG TPA: hypothetical protein VJK73_00530 [Candidatus Paceibacterota bacterium]